MTVFNRKTHSLQWIAVGDLTVHWPEAQRALAERKAKEIAETFDPDLFGTVTVSPLPDGKYHVDDGWTRTSAVRIKYGDGERVPCTIVQAIDAARAAEIFHNMNGARSKPTAMQMFMTGVTAGFPAEVAVSCVCTELGFKIEMSGADGAIRAVGALLSIYKQFGGDALRDTLMTIRSVWGLETAAYDANLLKGFALFLTQNEGEVDRNRLSKKLARRFTPGRLIGSAKATREAFGGSMSRAVAALVQEVHTPARVAKAA